METWPGGKPDMASARVAAVVDDIAARYGPLSAEELSKIGHREAPWRKARAGLAPGARSNSIIDRDA
jgi:uncharacterized phage-associated protein